MSVLNFDVLACISQYSHLRDRYAWSVCHRHFRITTGEWQCIIRRLRVSSVAELRRVCLRQCCSWITPRRDCLWSEQLQEPLRIWSPWTVAKLCSLSSSNAYFRFREHRFVRYVQDILQKFSLTSSAVLRFKGDVCVYATVWSVKTAKIPMLVRGRSKIRRRRCFVPTFQGARWDKLRCLLEFRIRDHQLKLTVQHLEFSVL